jgi:Kinesin motor domain
MASTDSLSGKVANAQTCNVQVAVRCRPPNAEEKKGNQPTVIACDSENKTINVSYGPIGKKSQKQYNFDKVFGMYSTQEEVFKQVVRPIVDEVLAGFNCTIFAYGQTGIMPLSLIECIIILNSTRVIPEILSSMPINRYRKDTHHGR